MTLEGGAIKKKLEEEFECHWKFMGAVLGQRGKKKLPRIDKWKYARYLLTEETIEAKRTLRVCIKSRII
ncbi:MAG: hypothetical protein PHX87_01820 [Candidatus Peribacteraceae bacterium]|nr:hypothetical protein [Candidatus Peribacteraceae bacterium]MDD5742144.1 hypothetical protein [Candidatus Peribacteraceae bacterium]